jgi:hypothetical protein
MSFVRICLRWLLTAFVVAACAAQPIALDACRAACDSARTRVATAPPCHHAASSGPQMGQPARSCSQEHAVVPADPGVGGPAQSVAFVSLAPTPSPFGTLAPRPGLVVPWSRPPAIPISSESNTPLRV